MITRFLPPEEWHRIKGEHLSSLLALVEPENIAVVVVEDDGEIVACLSALRTTFLEGTWIAPEHRGNAGILRALLRQVTAVPRVRGERWAFCFADEGQEKIAGYIKRLGGSAMPGGLYVLPTGAN